MRMTITDLKRLDSDSLFDLIRTVLGYRLINAEVRRRARGG